MHIIVNFYFATLFCLVSLWSAYYYCYYFSFWCSSHSKCGPTRCRKHWTQRKRVMLLSGIKISELQLSATPRSKWLIAIFFIGINCHFELLRIPSRCLQLAILFLAYQNCISVSLGCKQYQIFFVLCELPKTEADEE